MLARPGVGVRRRCFRCVPRLQIRSLATSLPAATSSETAAAAAATPSRSAFDDEDAAIAQVVDASTRRIMSLYTDFGHNEYIGEPFSIMEHSVQTAAAARANGESAEVQLSCLLHDVGHLLGLEANAPPDMDGCGVIEHERVGAEFLGALGFSDTVSYLALHHVNAKRYRCATEPEYFSKLSPASVTTLHHQGGPMSPEECAEVERDRRWPLVLRMRSYDEEGKDPTLEEGDPTYYRGMVRENLEQAIRQQLAESASHEKMFPLTPHAATYVVSSEQLRMYKQHGFVHIPNALCDDMTARLICLGNEAAASLTSLSMSADSSAVCMSPRQIEHDLASAGTLYSARARNMREHLSTWNQLCCGLAQDVADQLVCSSSHAATLVNDTLYLGTQEGSAIPDPTSGMELTFMVALEEQVVDGLSFHGSEFVLDGEVAGAQLVCKVGDCVVVDRSALDKWRKAKQEKREGGQAMHRMAHVTFARS